MTIETEERKLWAGEISSGPSIYDLAVSLTFHSSISGYGFNEGPVLVSFGITPKLMTVRNTMSCDFSHLHASVKKLERLYSYESWEIECEFPGKTINGLHSAFGLLVDGFGKYYPVILQIPCYSIANRFARSAELIQLVPKG